MGNLEFLKHATETVDEATEILRCDNALAAAAKKMKEAGLLDTWPAPASDTDRVQESVECHSCGASNCGCRAQRRLEAKRDQADGNFNW